MITLRQDHLDLLQVLVDVIDAAGSSPLEGFAARKIGVAGTYMFHTRAAPIQLHRMEDLDVLADRGWIELRYLPSGTYVFSLTSRGHKANAHALSELLQGDSSQYRGP